MECDALRRKDVERARYDSDLARRRYMQVDPDNRLVADSLEAEWNEKLRALEQAQQHYERQRQIDAAGMDEAQRAGILRLAGDFPRLWNDPRTPERERKRMVRLLIADVTLLKAADITAQIRFNGGTTQTLHLELPKTAWEMRTTPAEVVARIDQLLDDHTEGEIAELLNAEGLRSGSDHPFNPHIVRHIRIGYCLNSRYERLRSRGLLTQQEIAAQMDVQPCTIKLWRRAGLLGAHRFDDRGQCLFEPPTDAAPVKHQHQGKMRALAAASRANCNQPDR